MGRNVYVGVDLETSGTDIGAGALPIQVGLALGAGLQYSSLVGWPLRDGGRTDLAGAWSAESEEVHGITLQAVCDAFGDGRNAAPRGSLTGTQGMPRAEAAKIPRRLSTSIMRAAERDL